MVDWFVSTYYGREAPYESDVIANVVEIAANPKLNSGAVSFDINLMQFGRRPI